MGLAARLKRYSPACRTRLRPAKRASRNSQRERTTPACTSASAMPLVPVPRGKFDEDFALEALVGLLQAVDHEAAGDEPEQQQEAEQAEEVFIGNPGNSARG